MPHNWHLLGAGINEVIHFVATVLHCINKALIALREVEEEVDESVDNLGGQSILLCEEDLYEEARANRVRHL